MSTAVELDGRICHESVEQRDRDLERDPDQAVQREGTTLRLGYGQVYRHECRTAAKVGSVMQRRGRRGEPIEKCGGPDQAS